MVPKSGDPRSDLELAAVVRDGNAKHRREAFDILALRNQAWLGRLVYSLLGGEAAAEDVLQDTFVRAFLASAQIPEGPGMRAWFRTIATRTAYNHRRESRTRERYSHEYGEMPVFEGEEEPGLVSREALEIVLGELNYPMREMLVLRYVEEMSVPEIATHLELGLSAAKMRLARARGEFLAVYDKHVPATEGEPR